MAQPSQFDEIPPDRLAELFRSEPSAKTEWKPAEIAAIYRHQLETPLQAELGNLPPKEAELVAHLATAQGLLLKSIGDLLLHPHPPVPLLTMLKDFSKRLMEHPDSPLPRDVASLFYWSSIAAGLKNGKVRLTSLDDRRLIEGLQWAARQPWVDRPTADMIRSAEEALSSGAAHEST
jgi:hypothetical protein